MSSVRSIAQSVVVAAAVAISLIIVALYVPAMGLGNNVAQNSSSNAEGTMAVLLTDPPAVPENVSAVYIGYTMVEAHIANAGNASGWYDLGGSGELNLMSVVNASQTIASSNVPAGNFNGLRFNVTSVMVSYSPNPEVQKSQNYSGLMIHGRNTLYVWIPGGISVTRAQDAVAMIDLTPTILFAGTSSSPTFVFIPSARGYVVPNASIPAESHSIGARSDLNGNSWWASVQAETKFAITGVSLSTNSVNITVTNQGASPVELRLAGVTTQSSVSGGREGVLEASDIFLVQDNATLVSLNASSAGVIQDQAAQGGYLLAPGQSITINYIGPIVIGAQVTFPKYVPPPVAVGNYYTVWVYGNGQVAQAAAKVT
jgi:hypothetical protein